MESWVGFPVLTHCCVNRQPSELSGPRAAIQIQSAERNKLSYKLKFTVSAPDLGFATPRVVRRCSHVALASFQGFRDGSALRGLVACCCASFFPAPLHGQVGWAVSELQQGVYTIEDLREKGMESMLGLQEVTAQRVRSFWRQGIWNSTVKQVEHVSACGILWPTELQIRLPSMQT